MKIKRADKLKTMLEKLENTVDEGTSKKLELEKCHRIIQKLSSFSADCEACEQYFADWESHILQIRDRADQLREEDVTQHKQKKDNISAHLQKEHKLVTSGYYLSIYMTMGMSLGVVFGLLIFDNIGLALPIGFGIGLAIGAGLDAEAEKKGMVL
jgi:F0F1-type ATP synthase assembly protein I